ncbi:hypothetical protein GOC74_05145 [Halomicrobium mukohataei]|uniref:Envelope protein N-terminal domain-containing protein n=1 Tax=Halomicrobium mukohataei TaxID=57705 RepID=A0A847U9W8_9EURY|nr:hypothetical protein [Halomicrobium mukohataei]NLV09316.1 hypothetical protein [Halomicrobium mukohataei]
MVAFILVSAVGMPLFAGTAVAQTQEEKTAVEKCSENITKFGAQTVLIGVAECIGGAFSPAEYDSSPELETESWNSIVAIQDSEEKRQKAFNNWGELSKSNALQTAEKPIIEAHYAGEDSAQARSAGADALSQYYSSQLSSEYAHRTNVVERAYSVSKATAQNDNVGETGSGLDDVYPSQTGLLYWEVSGNESGTTTNPNYHVTPTADSSLKYVEKGLPNGETMESIAAVTHITQTWTADDITVLAKTDSSAFTVDHYALAFDKGWVEQNHVQVNGSDWSSNNYEEKLPAVVAVNADGQVSVITGSQNEDYDDAGMVAMDPYSSDSADNVNLAPTQQSITRASDADTERNNAMSEMQTMVDDLYSTHETGTINPEDYVSPATLTNQYATEDSHYSYASAVATMNGLQTDLESAQTITWTDGSEYEGQVLFGGSGNALADSEGQSYVQRSNSMLSFSETTKTVDGEEVTVQEDTVTMDTSTNSYSITGVYKVSDSAYTVSDDGTSVTIEKDGLNKDYVLMDVEYTDGSGNTVTDTIVLYANEDAQSQGIPSGLEVGTQYTVSNLDNSVMMSYQSGDSASVKTADSGSFTITDAKSAATGNSIKYIEYDDGGQRTFTDTSNLTEELEERSQIQDALVDRGDIDPAGAGGSGDGISDTIKGFGAGILAAIGGGFFLIVLFLIGRITSIA